MKNLKLLAASGLIALAAISPASANDANTTPAKKTTKATKSFLKAASIGGMFEIDSSKLALEKSQDPNVKAFAQKMVDDHSSASDSLKNTVAQDGIDPANLPEQLDAKHQAVLDKLNADSADKFDKDYIKAQTDAHKEAVAAFTTYSKQGDDKAIRDFATNTLPTLQEHKTMVSQLKPAK